MHFDDPRGVVGSRCTLMVFCWSSRLHFDGFPPMKSTMTKIKYLCILAQADSLLLVNLDILRKLSLCSPSYREKLIGLSFYFALQLLFFWREEEAVLRWLFFFVPNCFSNDQK